MDETQVATKLGDFPANAIALTDDFVRESKLHFETKNTGWSSGDYVFYRSLDKDWEYAWVVTPTCPLSGGRPKLPDPVGVDSLVSRLNAGQRIELGVYDMRQHLASATHGANE